MGIHAALFTPHIQPNRNSCLQIFRKSALPHRRTQSQLLFPCGFSAKGNKNAAPRLPKHSFSKAHLVKLTPLLVTLQTPSAKQTLSTYQRNTATSRIHGHSCAA